MLVVCDARAWNPQSAVPLDKELALVFEFDGDRIIRSEYYFDGKPEALEAVGLRDQRSLPSKQRAFKWTLMRSPDEPLA